jgi:hypothetical protein
MPTLVGILPLPPWLSSKEHLPVFIVLSLWDADLMETPTIEFLSE